MAQDTARRARYHTHAAIARIARTLKQKICAVSATAPAANRILDLYLTAAVYRLKRSVAQFSFFEAKPNLSRSRTDSL